MRSGKVWTVGMSRSVLTESQACFSAAKKKAPESSGAAALVNIGRSGRIRTPDHWFWRPAL